MASGNSVQVARLVATKMLKYFDNDTERGLIKYSNRQISEEMVSAKGQEITYNTPPHYTVQNGPELSSIQAVTTGKKVVKLNKWATVAVSLDGIDRALSQNAFSDWADMFLQPAAAKIMNQIEGDIGLLANTIGNCVGTAGSVPSTPSVFTSAWQTMVYNSAPQNELFCAVTPEVITSMVGGSTTIFNPQQETRELVTRGILYDIAGLKMFNTVNLPVHTMGTFTGTPKVNGANQTGATLVTNTWVSADKCTAGTRFTLPGVYTVNQASGKVTPILQVFVATADATADAGGNMTIPIYPAIITQGANATVSTSPTTGNSLTIVGGASASTHSKNIAFYKNALGLITAKAVPPSGLKSTTVSKNGMSLTVCHGPDIMSYKDIWRIDIPYDVFCYYPDQCCVITN